MKIEIHRNKVRTRVIVTEEAKRSFKNPTTRHYWHRYNRTYDTLM